MLYVDPDSKKRWMVNIWMWERKSSTGTGPEFSCFWKIVPTQTGIMQPEGV